MRILAYVDNLQVGGSQQATIDLASGLQRRGHEVVLVSADGPLAAVAREGGLVVRLIPPGRHPRRSVAGDLAGVVADVRPDVVHAVGSSAALEALSAAARAGGVPVVCQYPGDKLPPFVPRTVPVVAGQPRVIDEATGRNPSVHLVRAPVDTVRDHPGIDGSAFRAAHTDGRSMGLAVLVSRLVPRQKPTGVRLAVEAAGVLAARRPFRLVIVGDGKLRPEVERWAAEAGEGAVHLVGMLPDPREAHAAADVVVGQGTAVLRGMAQGRPAVVLGPTGGALPAEPGSREVLSGRGWQAPGPAVDAQVLAALLEGVLDDAGRAAELGRWGRAVVEEERGADAVAERLEPVLEAAVAAPPARAAVTVDLARSWARWWARVGTDGVRRRIRLRREPR